MSDLPAIDNRELSWLKFNQRVLEEAEDVQTPLFERLKFVSIFSSNLDEFCMVRVGTLYDQSRLKNDVPENKTNLTAAEQLRLIADKISRLLPQEDRAYCGIMQRLGEFGIVHEDINSLSETDFDFLKAHFASDIQPFLFPGLIDKKHPMPFLKNLDTYIGAELQRKNDEKSIIGILPAEGGFDRIVRLPGDGLRFVLAEEVILLFAELVFSSFDLGSKCIFRITRNADIDVNEALFDQDLDFRDVMEELVKNRRKLHPIRLQFSHGISGEIGRQLMKKIGVSEEFTFTQTSPLDMSFIFKLEELVSAREDLFYPVLTPQSSPMINPSEPLIKQILRGDIFLSYPYESFKPLISLIREAAEDEKVFSIKITLYRVARDSKIINALIRAAENGKSVLALVELRARFDEENNIGWSKRLEDAGVTVIYGLDDMKVHTKLLQITLKSGDSIQYITQVGTGNYNEKTAKLYTDMTIFTADKDIGADASVVFNALSMGTTVESSTALLVAPRCMKSRIVEMIDNEITYGEAGYIGIKINSLTDKDIIDKLIEANQKGVKIEMVVRGICCLIAGVAGKTENITVTSIVGRFLEHSRIYIFGTGERKKVYISSADFMTRNMERRVEVAAPIRNEKIKARICEMFEVMKNDNVKARLQLANGSYYKNDVVGEPLDSQLYFYEEAYKAAKAIPEQKPQADGFIARLGGFFKARVEAIKGLRKDKNITD